MGNDLLNIEHPNIIEAETNECASNSTEKLAQSLSADISASNEQLLSRISKASSKDELEELYRQFNINNSKKNVIRINKLNDLLDAVIDQANERFQRRPDEVSNKELIDYMGATQSQLSQAQQNIDNIHNIQAIQINGDQTTNNNININVGGVDLNKLGSESRHRILDCINDILGLGTKIDNSEYIAASEARDKPVIEPLEGETSEEVAQQMDDFLNDDSFEGDNE